MAEKGDWFTIVASDLFAGAFAAILIIDAATPKRPLALGQPTLVDIRYDVSTEIGGTECRDPTNIAFIFRDDTGEEFNTLNLDLAGRLAGGRCQIIGVVDDVALSAAPTEAEVLLIYRPGAEPLGTVDVTLQNSTLTCTEDAPCSTSGS